MGRKDLRVSFVHCPADDVSDVDMVELYEEDFKTIDHSWKLSDTMMDKLTFTVSTTVYRA